MKSLKNFAVVKRTILFKSILVVIFTTMSFVTLTASFGGKALAHVNAWDGSVASTFAGGDGASEETAYQISSGAELKLLSDIVNKVEGTVYNGRTLLSSSTNGRENDFDDFNDPGELIYYKLTNDIYLNDISKASVWGEGFAPKNKWAAIGNSTEEFNASFDGDGYSVKGVYINKNGQEPEDGDQGLFGYVGTSGIVKNTGVVNSFIRGSNNTAGVVGNNSGRIENCFNNANIKSSDNYTGGVVGNSSGTVLNCYNTGTILGSMLVGGVMGNNQSGIVDGCYNEGTVSSNSDVGGVVGYNYKGTIVDSYNKGTVNATGDYIGGVSSYNDGTIENSYNMGSVNSKSSYVGGIVYQNDSGGVINNSYNTGSVNGIGYAGSIASNNKGTINNCYFLEGRLILNGVTQTGGDDKAIGTSTGSSATAKFNSSGVIIQNGTSTNDTMSDITSVSIVEDTTRLLDALNEWVTNEHNEDYSVWVADGYFAKFDGQTSLGESMIWDNSISYSLVGDGDIANPYQISSGADLAFLAEVINDGTSGYSESDKYYILTNDIYLNSTYDWQSWDSSTNTLNEWTAIGNSTAQFNGNFDGFGYSIYGIYISRNTATESDKNQGLFGYVGESGIIKNVGVSSGYINGYSNVGGIAGYNCGIITNCYNASKVKATNEYAGGIAGYNNSNSTITNCYNTTLISGIRYVGGIVGNNKSSIINNCFNTSPISAQYYGGGIAGINSNNSTITNCYNIGTISAYDNVGGIVGANSTATISNCYNVGTVATTSKAGGIVGYNYNANTVINCYFLEGRLKLVNTVITGEGDKAIGTSTGSSATAKFNSSGVIIQNGSISGTDTANDITSVTIIEGTTTLLKVLNVWTAINQTESDDYLYFESTGLGMADTMIPYRFVDSISFSITFDANGGESAPSQTVDIGELILKPADPNRSGYSFDGWFTDEACTNAWDFATNVVTDDTTLYAKWTQLIKTYEYTILSEGADYKTLGKYSNDTYYQLSIDYSVQFAINMIAADANQNPCTIFFGDGVVALNVGTLIFGGSEGGEVLGVRWGAITLQGKIQSSISNVTIGAITLRSGVSITSTADISNSLGTAIYNQSTGAVNISGGTVQTAATTSYASAIYNQSTGAVNISGGTVQTVATATYSYAIYNQSTGAINISGGTVQTLAASTYSYAICNSSTGKITISETDPLKPTLIASNSYVGSAIRLCEGESGQEILNISGGAVESQVDNSSAEAICNEAKGTINISGGRLEAGLDPLGRGGGIAILNYNASTINMSGGTIQSYSSVAVHFVGAGNFNLSGGTVRTDDASSDTNTPIIFGSGGSGLSAITITGGAIIAAKATNYAILNENANVLTYIGGNPTITGKIGVHANNLSVIDSGNDAFTPADGSLYRIELINISSDAIIVGGGAAFSENFELVSSSYVKMVNGNNLVATNIYTVSFNLNGAIGSKPSSQSIVKNEKVQAVSSPTRTNYTFGGWFKEAACQNEWIFDTDVVTKSLTLYAKWTLDSPVITDSANNVSQVFNDIDSALSITIAPIADFEIVYTWYKKVGDSFEEVQTGSSSYLVKNVADSGTYKVRATITDTIQTAYVEKEFTVSITNAPQIAPAKPSVQDRAYNSVTLGAILGAEYSSNGTDWQDSPTFAINETTAKTLTFYARLKAKTNYSVSPASSVLSVQLYTVTFNYMDGTGFSVTHTIVEGVALMEVKISDPTRSGYNFENWHTSVDNGTTLSATPLDFTQNASSSVVLYAKWAAITVVITTEGALQDGVYNDTYSTTISASTTSGTLVFSVSFGALPDGLSLDTATGVISGTTTKAGNFSFKIKALNSTNGLEFDEKEYSIFVAHKAIARPTLNGATDLVFDNTDQTVSVVHSLAVGYDVGGDGLTQKNADTYTVTFTLKPNYKWDSGIEDEVHQISFSIAKRTITVTADSDQSKQYGESDPTFTFSVTAGELADGDSFSGALTRAEGNQVGSYDIWQGDLTAGANYIIEFESAKFTITKATATIPTLTIVEVTKISVTLMAVAGAEYSKNGTDWQDSNVFSNLSVNTQYVFYIRLKETATHLASTSASASVVTSNHSFYTMSFETNGGSSIAPIENVQEGKTFTRPSNPVRDGYLFKSWYTDEALTSLYNWNTPASSNITLYAAWNEIVSTATFTVTFMVNGVVYETQTVAQNSTPTKPADPVIEGMSFVAWCTDSALTSAFNFASGSVTKDTTLFARFAEVTYSISGAVVDSHQNPMPFAVVYLKQGNTVYSFAMADALGGFVLTNLDIGTYNIIVMTDQGFNKTEIITVSDNITDLVIVLPEHKTNSTIEIDDNTRDVIVGGIEDLHTDEDKEWIDANGGKVEIKVVVTEKNKDEVEEVNSMVAVAANNNQEIGGLLDISVYKTLISESGLQISSDRITSIATAIQIVIPLLETEIGMVNYVIYRIHDGNVEIISNIPNESGELIALSADGKSLILYVRNFSYFAVGFDAHQSDEQPRNLTSLWIALGIMGFVITVFTIIFVQRRYIRELIERIK